MKIYVRKIDNQFIEKQVSYTKEILKDFLDDLGDHDTIVCEGKESHEKSKVALLLATDPRFDNSIKKILKAEGEFEINDLMIMYKLRSKYLIELVKKGTIKYNSLSSLFADGDRHIFLENDGEIYDDIFEHNLYGIHIKYKNDALSETNPHICIGWSKLGDLTSLATKDELKNLYENTWPQNSKNNIGINVGQIWRFKDEAKIGDYVVLAESNYIHIGKIDSDYVYDATSRPEQDEDYVNTRKVVWLKTNIDRAQLSINFHRSLTAAMSFFTLNDYRSAIADLLKDDYKKDESTDEIDDSQLKDFDFSSSSITDGQNLVVYGTPGCGKSYYVEHTLLKDYSKENYIRTTFFQDYTNTDFVGQILPIVEGDKVTYKFNPGPFTLALEKAIKNPNEKVALVIEELNRGSAASIFGDIFQLLDRKNGVSEYPIVNVNIIDYLNEKFRDTYTFKEIRIPGNLSIFATMNTSDQNVFVLDNAFKRRWKFKKLLNVFNADHKFKDKFIPGPVDKADYTWEEIVNLINNYILSKADDINNEDKQIGVYFVDEKGMREDKLKASSPEDIEAFAYKLLEYLWDDVARFSHSDWFEKEIKSLDQLVGEYKTKGVEVFIDESFRKKGK